MSHLALAPVAANDPLPPAVSAEHIAVALLAHHAPDAVLRRVAVTLTELHEVQALRDGPNGYATPLRLVREEIAARRAVGRPA